MLQGWMDSEGFVVSEQSQSPRGNEEISASAQMEAEIPRVLHALAVPEYMEAWLRVPEAERIECRSDPRSFDRFRIDLFAAGRRRGSIYGSCLLTKPNRITYLWDSSMNRGVRSLVEIRLWGGLTGCILKLRHCGLTTPDEKEWYTTMWRDSLNNLCSLMEGTGARPTRGHCLNRSVPAVP